MPTTNSPRQMPHTRIMCFIIYHNKLVECHVIGRQWRQDRRETMESSRVWWWIQNSRTPCCCWPAVVVASVTLRPIEFRLEFSSDRLNLFNFFFTCCLNSLKKWRSKSGSKWRHQLSVISLNLGKPQEQIKLQIIIWHNLRVLISKNKQCSLAESKLFRKYR